MNLPGAEIPERQFGCSIGTADHTDGAEERKASTTGRAGPLGPPPSDHLLPCRTKLSHEVPHWVHGTPTYFLTICCVPRGLNHLCREPAASAVFEAVAFRHRTERWQVHLLLLMPDHLHALVSLPRAHDLGKTVANFKELTAKRAGILWQRDFFDHRIRARESLREKWDYICLNPVRKGLARSPDDWPYVWRPESEAAGPAVPPYPKTTESIAGGPARP